MLRATTACNFSSLICLHSTFHFSRKSRKISFLTLLNSKIEELSQNCLVFDVVKFKNWGSLAELFRFISFLTRNISCQILCICPTPAIVFEAATKPLRLFTFCSFLTRCTIPCTCHAKRHLNVQKCSVSHSFFALLTSMLRDTTACTFSTAQFLKVLRG